MRNGKKETKKKKKKRIDNIMITNCSSCADFVKLKPLNETFLSIFIF